MLKILLSTALMMGMAHAGEVKINVPFAALHTKDKCGSVKCNENLLDDGLTVGVSYMKDFVGFSYNTAAKNSFGQRRSHYFTADIMPKIYEDELLYVRVGGSVGFATGYKELRGSGVIPFAGGSVEGGIGNFSLQVTATPSYKQAPAAFIGMARFKLYEW